MLAYINAIRHDGEPTTEGYRNVNVNHLHRYGFSPDAVETLKDGRNAYIVTPKPGSPGPVFYVAHLREHLAKVVPTPSSEDVLEVAAFIDGTVERLQRVSLELRKAAQAPTYHAPVLLRNGRELGAISLNLAEERRTLVDYAATLGASITNGDL